jgi:hypothetical protein
MDKYAACVARRLRLYAMSVRCHAFSIHIYICEISGLTL